jgi:hypothetical protein
MADGLLLTRSDRLRAFGSKFGLAAAPSAALAVFTAVLGAAASAVAVAIIGGVLALAVATNARTTRGAAVAGVVCALLLVGFQIALSWIVSHPILPE